MSDFTRRFLEPLLIPLSAFVFVGGIGWGLSRMLLVTTKNGSAALALVASLAVLGACAALAGRSFRAPEKYASALAFVGIVAGGTVFAATLGDRPVHGHLPEPSFVLVAKTAAQFEQARFSVPAEEEIVVRFDNQDSAAPHNWQVVESKQALDKVIVDGLKPFTGPAIRDYLLEGVEEGSYYYFCVVHPGTMTGTLIVGEATDGVPTEAPPSPTGTATPTPVVSPGPSGAGAAPGSATLVAKDVAFDKASIALAAARQVSLTLDNRDTDPHNVMIAADEQYTNVVFDGEVFSGPAKKVYTFAAPTAGDYVFKCKVHPFMKGTVTFS